MGKGKNSGSSAHKKKVTEEDQEKALSVIENREFVAMRTAEKNWPAPSTKEEQLKELANLGLIQEQNLAEWRAPGEHRVPSSILGRLFSFWLLFALAFASQLPLFFIASSIILASL